MTFMKNSGEKSGKRLGQTLGLLALTAAMACPLAVSAQDKIYVVTGTSLYAGPFEPSDGDMALTLNPETGFYENTSATITMGKTAAGKPAEYPNAFKLYTKDESGAVEIFGPNFVTAIDFFNNNPYSVTFEKGSSAWYVNKFADGTSSQGEVSISVSLGGENPVIIATQTDANAEAPAALYLWGTEDGGNTNLKNMATLTPLQGRPMVYSATFDIPSCPGPFRYDDPEFKPTEDDAPTSGFMFLLSPEGENIRKSTVVRYLGVIGERTIAMKEGQTTATLQLMRNQGGNIIDQTPGLTTLTFDLETLELAFSLTGNTEPDEPSQPDPDDPTPGPNEGHDDSAAQVTVGTMWDKTGGMMALGVSNNGRYISGACTNWEGFVYDTKTKTLVTTGDFAESLLPTQGAAQFYAIDDNGYAYGWDSGGAVKLGVDGSYNLFFPIGEYFDVAPKGVTPDGSIIVGYVNSDFYTTLPCYWDALGNIHLLKYSTSQEAGFKINGCRANAVSTDGSIIMGWLESRSNRNPLVYWVRQSDGSYEYVPAFEGNYEDDRDVNGNYKTAYENYNNKLFTPLAMSSDGSTVALSIERVVKDAEGKYVISPEEVALYNLARNSITDVIPYDRNNLLYQEDLFTITGLTNDGVIMGMQGVGATATNPFLLFPDDYENAVTLIDAFPGIDLLEEYQAFYEDYHSLCMLTALSGDSSTIAGYLEYDIEVPGFSYPYGMATFYIRTGFDKGGESEVETIGTDEITSGKAVYYDLQGRKIASPDHGIYIRREGSKASKIIL